MKKLSIALLLTSQLVYAQSQCDCANVLNEVMLKTEANYAGYADKVNTKTRPRYTHLVDSLRAASKNLPANKSCYQLLKIYKKFFRDGHFQLYFNDPQATVPVRSIDTDETKAKAYFDANSASLHPIEGIWEATDGSYRVALMKDGTKIAAAILTAQNPSWKQGMVKFEVNTTSTSPYSGIYWAGDLSSSERTFPLEGNLMNIPNSGYWVRKYPQTATATELATLQQQTDTDFGVKPLDSTTVYIRIPTFNISSMMVDSVMKVHDAMIRKSPYLIIDIRDNGGGANSSFPPILKYLNTNNFKDIYSHFRSSHDKIIAEKNIIEQAIKQGGVSEKEAKSWKESILKNEKQKGKMVRSEGEDINFKEITPNPQKVAVLMNDGCYSSAEYFVYFAKQSKKVTLFGTHTGGVMDYGNVRQQKLSCPDFELSLPTTRSGWVDTAPIDNIGFQPNVKIPNAEKDWVKFVMEYQKK